MTGSMETAPAIAEPDGDDILHSIQALLTSLERATPMELAEAQFDALDRMLRHAVEHTDFYAGRLAPLFEDGEVDLSCWSAIPILTRHEATAHTSEMRARSVPEGTTVREGQTSGSSGTPLRFAWSTLTSVSTRAVVERMIAWHGLDPMATVAEIKSFPGDTVEYPGKRVPRSWSFRGRGTPYHRLVVTTPVETQLEWLTEIGAVYLLTYPTMARELALTALRLGSKLKLDAILTVGEMLTDEIRQLCRDAFGAKVIDSYGCQEAGKIAIECEVSGHYHVCVSNVLLEIVDDEGRQVPPGGVGRIVLTSLYNYAMPFIRYEVGDFARLGDAPCSCGRTLPVITEILGRRRNMLTLPDGNRLWLPGKVLAAMGETVPMLRMQLRQTARDRLELLYVPRPQGGAPDEAGLTRIVATNIHPHVTISTREVVEIPRSIGGKYEDVVGLT